MVYDQHIHSDFSYDSTQPMEAYVARAAGEGAARFITTEHLDFAPRSHDGDIVPDFAAQRALCARLSARYGIRVLFGVEAGWRPDQREKTAAALACQPFDLVLASIHDTPDIDYYIQADRAKFPDDKAVFAHYLAQIEGMVNDFDNFDVLAHVDYARRYGAPVSMADFEDVLSRIFTVLAKKDKALELNGRLVPKEGTAPSEYLARLFLACGGRRFTLGSDGHSLAAWQQGLAPLAEMLKGLGVPGLTVYEGRAPKTVPFL